MTDTDDKNRLDVSALNELLQVGHKIRIVYPENSPKSTRVIHIRAEIDTHMYAFCSWSKKEKWTYDIESFWWFQEISHRLELVGKCNGCHDGAQGARVIWMND